MDLQQLGLAAPSRERGVAGRGHAPVVAVLLGSAKENEPIAAPKDELVAAARRTRSRPLASSAGPLRDSGSGTVRPGAEAS
jgi:hypothetical protein